VTRLVGIGQAFGGAFGWELGGANGRPADRLSPLARRGLPVAPIVVVGAVALLATVAFAAPDPVNHATTSLSSAAMASPALTLTARVRTGGR